MRDELREGEEIVVVVVRISAAGALKETVDGTLAALV